MISFTVAPRPLQMSTSVSDMPQWCSRRTNSSSTKHTLPGPFGRIVPHVDKSYHTVQNGACKTHTLRRCVASWGKRNRAAAHTVSSLQSRSEVPAALHPTHGGGAQGLLHPRDAASHHSTAKQAHSLVVGVHQRLVAHVERTHHLQQHRLHSLAATGRLAATMLCAMPCQCTSRHVSAIVGSVSALAAHYTAAVLHLPGSTGLSGADFKGAINATGLQLRHWAATPRTQ